MSSERPGSSQSSCRHLPASNRIATGARVRWLALAAGIAVAAGAAADAPAAGSTKNAAIDKVLAEQLRPDQPGCSVAAMRDGKLLHTAAYGLADLAAHKPIDPGSIFNIASISKQFTAFSILLLADRKALSLDDPLIKYIPELSASARGVTLRHLLHHTGGLRDYTGLLMLRGRRMGDGATQFETIQTLGRQRASNFPAGTKFEYSNTGYVLLASVVERVSGRSMKQFAAENIFGPLGMKQTTIIDRYPAGLPKLVRGYSPGEKGYEVDESAWEQVGDGQVHTTASDLLLWAENFHTGRVGGLPLMQRMTQVGVLNSGEKLDYAAGLGVREHNGLPTVGHGGGWAGYRSQFLTFPQQHFAVTVFCNRTDLRPDKLANTVADIYLADEMRRTGKKSPEREREDEPAPAARWKPRPADYVGVYWSDEAEARCALVERGGHLYVEGCMPGYELQPGDDQELYSKDAATRLRFQGQAGKPSGFTLEAPALSGLTFTKE
jgi:CubicO group peptidase (beta-lactamase class C family)